ncbi:MAG: GAF domain-containing protein [Oscillatoriales cyanobacterium RM1_1_9]|nr:GAF domain-containing protein [Oscillatoriales cyanobacterium SM2_3_0]NJO71735.1 GAF domain-containing protein [Oscillatoriales cyanobacterium RM1_1_9]
MVAQSAEFFQELTQRTTLIEELLDIGIALSGTKSLGSLLNLILTKSREITCSDAGSVYLVDKSDDQPKLLFKIAQNVSMPDLSFREFAIPLTPKSLAGYVALTGDSLNIPDAYELSLEEPYQLDRSFDQDIHYRTRSVLVLPMQNHNGEILGILQLINRKVQPEILLTPENTLENTQPYTDWEERILRSLASQAAVSIKRNQLQDDIEHLFESFVRASVQAIEQRDPCTSGHSERVAALTVRLAQEVNTVPTGYLGSIEFDGRQFQEIRYAALLHDFGKIGVPEAILRKSKKLYPEQLEIIRHRFTLAQRTAEQDCLQTKYQLLQQHISQHLQGTTVCPHCQQLEQLDADLEATTTRLHYLWNLVLVANEPQVMAEEPLAELAELAELTYQEVDGQRQPVIQLEEIEQLQVHRGNLTPAERFVMESHVIHTYQFLNQIPWTQDLRDVPAIAYGHHERLDGTGYPQGLKSTNVPIQAQMMAIADVYDALTAGDRPYKHRIPTITALKILRQEATTHKINPNLLELFEQRQVYQVIGHSLDVVMKLA